jgi:peptidoglycan/LPS O-acetylase OafA/YrhL
VRLFAALQVAIHHAMTHLKIESSGLLWALDEFLRLFPGVPIFFFISGFLISRSYERNSVIGDFTYNRILRVFPALIVCGFLTFISICLSGYINFASLSIGDWVLWLLSQVTVFQSYDPDFLQGYGIGQSNGSLWTIYVELQFYVVLPILYLGVRALKATRKQCDGFFVLTAIAFIVPHLFSLVFFESGSMLHRLVKLSFVPYFFMFLVGVIFQRFFGILRNYFEGRFIWFLGGYLIVYYLMSMFGYVSLGHRIHPVLYLFLCCVIFSAAYSDRSRSQKLMGDHDISYGLYIYHMPVINLFMFLGLKYDWIFLCGALCTSVALATLSWLFIERPSLLKKRNPLYNFDPR